MKYKVVGQNPAWKPEAPEMREHHMEYAKELKETYGLPHSLEEIAVQWHWYSHENYCAGWLNDSKYSIEKCFGVVLEEIDGN